MAMRVYIEPDSRPSGTPISRRASMFGPSTTIDSKATEAAITGLPSSATTPMPSAPGPTGTSMSARPRAPAATSTC